jgi:hypothetical protein
VGSSIPTRDLDIVYERTRENVERLVTALQLSSAAASNWKR